MDKPFSSEFAPTTGVTVPMADDPHTALPAHISKENNYPELAYGVCYRALTAAGLQNTAGLETASADKFTALTEIV